VIGVRRHSVPIVAVVLALAMGIVLGAGPLQGGVDQQAGAAEENPQDSQALRAQLDEAAEVAAFQEAYAQSTSPLLLHERLQGRSVALVLLPGADPTIAQGIADDITAAGGAVTVRVQLQPDLLDPQNRQVAEGLAAQVLEQVEEVPPTKGASSYELVGYSLARGFLSVEPEGVPVDSAAQTVTASYQEADYLTIDGEVEHRAGLAVVVAAEPQALESGQAQLVTTLVQSLDTASGGVVVAGGPTVASDGGYVAAIRGSEAAQGVSTVDVADTSAGQVVTVLALAEQASGGVGQYGIDAPDGPVPDLSEQ